MKGESPFDELERDAAADRRKFLRRNTFGIVLGVIGWLAPMVGLLALSFTYQDWPRWGIVAYGAGMMGLGFLNVEVLRNTIWQRRRMLLMLDQALATLIRVRRILEGDR